MATSTHTRIETNGKLELSMVLPNDAGLEENVIADAMMNKKALVYLCTEVSHDDFYSSANARLFAAIVDIYQEHGKFEHFRLVSNLKESGELDFIGGAQRIAEITRKSKDFTAFTDHAEGLKKLAKLRKVANTLSKGLHDVILREKEPGKVAASVTDELLSVTIQNNKGWTCAADSIIENIEQRFAAVSSNRLIGHSTGLLEMDTYLGGIQPKYYIIAGRPSMGKSSLMKNIASNIVKTTGKPVGIFSLEMSETDLSNRDIADKGGVSLTTWSTLKGLSHAKVGEIAKKMATASPITSKIIQDTTTALSPGRLFAKCRQLLAAHPETCAFFIDYVQKMTSGKEPKGKYRTEDNRNAELTYISNKIQDYVKILGVPFIVLSQLSRNGVDEPQLHHLRDSGSLEQDCDVALLLHNPGFYDKNQPSNVCEVIIAKNKEGATGRIKLGWDGPHSRFYNLETHIKDDQIPAPWQDREYEPSNGVQLPF